MDTLKEVEKERGGCIFYLGVIVENFCQYKRYSGKYL